MIIIPKRLKALTEDYIKRGDRKRERGGYFFGSESKFLAFLPSPNFSKTPRNAFMRESGDHFAKEFSKLLDLSIVAAMHTHPGGSVVSEGDLRYLKAHNYLYEVVISDMKDGFRWFVVNRDSQEIGIIESEEELERLSFVFAVELGLTDLGRVFITPKNELLTNSKKGRTFLSLDTDSLRIYEEMRDAPKWRTPSKTELKEATDLSYTRVKRALEKLEENELI